MKNKVTFFMMSFLFFFSISKSFAQDFTEREYYGARLEPITSVVNCAGQSEDAFLNYWNVMENSHKPVSAMYYIGLAGIGDNWSAQIKKDHFFYSDYFVIPQIGLAMTLDGNPDSHYEDDVAAGLMDEEIDKLIEGIRNLGIPVYLRIGYEFNGVTWNGYEPDTYIGAYRRITDKIREAGLNVATVWNASMDYQTDLFQYYPGDDYVDWFGISLFSKEQFELPMAISFLDSAETKGKPMMIAESTPRYVGVLNGEQSWNLWFEKYFSIIEERPGIKMFSYINWNWSAYPQWQNWGDCRLEMNDYVSSQFNYRLSIGNYLQSVTESEFMQALGYTDTTPPSHVSGFSLTSEEAPIGLSWDESQDESGISRYVIYKNGIASDYSLETEFFDNNISTGDTVIYQVAAIDKAGNIGELSDELTVIIDASVEKILNGNFDDSFTGWDKFLWETSASFSINTDSQVTGQNSAQIEVSDSPGTNWHIQLRQPVQIKKGKRYIINYKAKAELSSTIEVWLQMDHEPYNGYYHKNINLSENILSVTDTISVSSDDFTQFTFMVGNSGNNTFYFDDISVVEISDPTTSVKENNSDLSPESFVLYGNYPNPFNPTTTFSFELTSSQMIIISVFDINGRLVYKSADTYVERGLNSYKWNASEFSSGVYFVNFSGITFNKTTKIMLLK